MVILTSEIPRVGCEAETVEVLISLTLMWPYSVKPAEERLSLPGSPLIILAPSPEIAPLKNSSPDLHLLPYITLVPSSHVFEFKNTPNCRLIFC